MVKTLDAASIPKACSSLHLSTATAYATILKTVTSAGARTKTVIRVPRTGLWHFLITRRVLATESVQAVVDITVFDSLCCAKTPEHHQDDPDEHSHLQHIHSDRHRCDPHSHDGVQLLRTSGVQHLQQHRGVVPLQPDLQQNSTVEAMIDAADEIRFATFSANSTGSASVFFYRDNWDSLNINDSMVWGAVSELPDQVFFLLNEKSAAKSGMRSLYWAFGTT